MKEIYIININKFNFIARNQVEVGLQSQMHSLKVKINKVKCFTCTQIGLGYQNEYKL